MHVRTGCVVAMVQLAALATVGSTPTTATWSRVGGSRVGRR